MWWFLRLLPDQKLLIRKQGQTGVSIYRRGDFPSSTNRSVRPKQGRLGVHARSGPSALRAFIASTFVPASNRGILFMGRAIILLAIVGFHSVAGFALDPNPYRMQAMALHEQAIKLEAAIVDAP